MRKTWKMEKYWDLRPTPTHLLLLRRERTERRPLRTGGQRRRSLTSESAPGMWLTAGWRAWITTKWNRHQRCESTHPNGDRSRMMMDRSARQSWFYTLSARLHESSRFLPDSVRVAKNSEPLVYLHKKSRCAIFFLLMPSLHDETIVSSSLAGNPTWECCTRAGSACRTSTGGICRVIIFSLNYPYTISFLFTPFAERIFAHS